MLYALNAAGTKIRAERGAEGACPGCGAELIPKCGEILIHHWSHRGEDNCDPWYQGETDWHRAWKALFPVEWCEVSFERDGSKHRADVVTPKGVIEFQHSPLSLDAVREREIFYGAMYWVFHAQDAFEADRLWIKKMKADEQANRDTAKRYWRWTHSPSAPMAVSRRQFWDVGNTKPLFEPTHRFPRLNDEGEIKPAAGVGHWRPRTQAIKIMSHLIAGNTFVAPWMPDWMDDVMEVYRA
jgi:hypothetical protein